MPDLATFQACRPKCPIVRTTGTDSARCATPMHWHDAQRVWVCPAHPHMEVRPDDFTRARLAPKGVRDRAVYAR